MNDNLPLTVTKAVTPAKRSASHDRAAYEKEVKDAVANLDLPTGNGVFEFTACNIKFCVSHSCAVWFITNVTCDLCRALCKSTTTLRRCRVRHSKRASNSVAMKHALTIITMTAMMRLLCCRAMCACAHVSVIVNSASSHVVVETRYVLRACHRLCHFFV
jgi:hypothetical protein